MTQQASIRFDFDQWSKLARDDPQAFELERARVLDRAIDQAPDARRERLRCLQWRIDQVRRRARTPMSACVEMSRLMWDSVLGERGLLESLRGLDSHLEHGAHPTLPPAGKVLPFRSLARR